MAPVIEKLQNKGLSVTIGEELVRLIASGSLKPGQRLNEAYLAESFGVSRGPVREAARELEGQGLIVSRPRQGFFVADFTAQQIVDLYEVKRWIDHALIHDVLTYSDPASRAEVLADLDTIDTSEKVAFANSLFAFRQRWVARLHNSILAAYAMSLYRQFHIVTALIDAPDPPARMDRIVNTLRAFWTALVAGDEEAAKRIMQEDAEYWQKDVVPRFGTEADDSTQTEKN